MKKFILLANILFIVGYSMGGTWTILDAPEATRTHITDIDGNNLVGYYKDSSRYHGFLYNRITQQWTILDAPGVGVATGQATHIEGIDGDNLVGYFSKVDGIPDGFLYNITTQQWTIFDKPGATDTRPLGVDGSNIVGWYHPSTGFVYDGVTWETLKAPDENTGLYLTGIDGVNVIGYDNNINGLLYNTEKQIWTTINAPDASMTYPLGIDNSNIVGYYFTYATGYTGYHGFLYDGLTWTTLDAPGAVSGGGTHIEGIDGSTLVGYYYDSGSAPHGFIYTIDPEPTTLSISSPNGSGTYSSGTTRTITWESEGEIVNVILDYSIDNGSTWLPIKTVPNTGSTTWIIPNTPSSTCLIKISDVSKPEIFDISDAPFTIQSAYPTVTYPNGGQSYQTGTKTNIYWTTMGAFETAFIEYSTDNGGSWIGVNPPNVGNTNAYLWTIPYTLSDQCLVRVSDADNLSSNDVSNEVFSIVPSTPQLLLPIGGERLLTGTTFEILWNTRGFVNQVLLEFSSDLGENWNSIEAAPIANSGRYSWVVPYALSEQCLVKISDADHPEVFNVSAEPFQIIASAPGIISPNGGEKLLSGTTMPIQWSTTGVVAEVMLEYSLDNGLTWQETSPSNSGNTGSYDWTIPLALSQQCLVRVSDRLHSETVNAVSNLPFQISPLYIVNPNGGENLLMDSKYPVKWITSSVLMSDTIQLSYSINEGLDWIVITATENDGQYEWDVPMDTSTTCLLKLVDTTTPNWFDISDNYFSIYQCSSYYPGDINKDCYVNLLDFVLLTQDWMKCTNPYDSNCESDNIQVILQEDWEQGINPEKWHIYGDPLPYLYQGKAVRGIASFSNNGDSMYPSGVVSKNTFTLVPNMTITFWSNLHAEGAEYRDFNQHNDVWLTTSPLVNFDEDQKADLLLPWIRHHGGEKSQEHESGYTIYNGEPKLLVDAEPDFGKWVKFAMTTLPDGSIEYYKNGVLAHKTNPGTISYSPNQLVRLVISGKSLQSVLLVDDVRVEVRQ